MTRYRCASCDETFELPTDDERPRCPSCLRQHGLEAVTPPGAARRRPPARRRRHLLKLLVGLFALGLLGAGVWSLVRRRTDLPTRGALAMLDEGLLRRTLERRGVAAADQVNPFSSNAALRSLAGADRPGARSNEPARRARALAARLAAALDQAKPPVALDLTGRADAPIRDAATLITALKGNKLRSASSLELAALLTSTLRQAGLTALLCQLHEIDAPVRTADVAGGIGRYAACVYKPQGLGSKPAVALDPARALALPAWAGGGGDPQMAARTTGDPLALGDASAAAHLLSQRALRLRNREPDRAYRLSAMATVAAAPSSTLQLARARVLAAAGGTSDARTAAQKALSLRDGPATRTTLAQVLLSAGDAFAAAKHLERALKQDRSFWPAHQTLAAVTMTADPERSAKHLEAGLAVAPQEASLLLLKATRLLGAAKTQEALTLLRAINARQPTELSRLMYYQALKRAGDDEAAKAVGQQLLESAGDRKKIQQVLQAMDRALEQEESPPGGASSPVAPPPPPPPPPAKLTLPDVKLGR